ncbi:aldehyde dehydrogenase family protein [Cesiribacter andamanensis]|uniref:Aldehyde dehydrogenase n=1 Tax=Cesiribacter andamanensis AMV16 TaxID=1279009 RepID=M7N7Y6_9BACT|nr:aldehyde dehydrogenase family protein [Cesiribacter andamanensis]EMR04713.1 Coniferyl aldehyde dehydrogenase [Cesiribacter andamanensis AMV16]
MMHEQADSPPAPTTDMPARMQQVFEQQRQTAQAWRSSTLAERQDRLRNMLSWMEQNRNAIHEALYNDFQKPHPETDISEIYPVQAEIKHALRNLRNWMKPRKVSTPLSHVGTSSYIQYEPKGVCLIIAPWNYPFNLQLVPLVSCLAAGCTAILKPAEETPHTAQLLERMVGELFSPREVAVFTGGKEVAQELLKLPFDHIFFTGSPQVGKLVMKAAAEHLSSVTLELGGKSPAIVDYTANLKEAAERIAFGKWLNAGQTCIAPDYVLVHERVSEPLVQELKKAIAKMYGGEGPESKASHDLARIINQRHFERLQRALQQALAAGAELASGGTLAADERFIAPTVLRSVPEDSQLMQEEIFGPILPIRSYRDLAEAVEYVNARPKPLALYLFTDRPELKQEMLQRTSAGGVCVNDTALHYLQPNLPFGGVNWSGMGKAHGHWGFLSFSNEKSVLQQRSGLTSTSMLKPPYSPAVQKMINLLLRYL